MKASDLQNMGFELSATADVSERNGVPDIMPTYNSAASKKEPGVYCWVIRNTETNNEMIVYVGKYGVSVRKRFGEHLGGFRGGSASGVKKAQYLIDLLSKPEVEMEIWSKPSYAQEIEFTDILGNVGKKTISTYGTDEEIMISYVTQQQGSAPALNGTRGG